MNQKSLDKTTPSLNTYLEENRKEFDIWFDKTFGVSEGPGVYIPDDDRERIWSFISASISEAWELKVKKKYVK